MNLSRIFLSVALALGFSAAYAQDYSYTVKRGDTIRIFSWSFFGPTCRVTDYPKIRAVKGGSLGTLTSGRGPIKVYEVSESNLLNCVGKTVQGTIVNYTAGNTAGTDQVRLARERMSGADARYTIQITVQ